MLRPPTILLANVCEFCGVVLIAYGLLQVWTPLAWLWLGVAAFYASFALEKPNA